MTVRVVVAAVPHRGLAGRRNRRVGVVKRNGRLVHRPGRGDVAATDAGPLEKADLGVLAVALPEGGDPRLRAAQPAGQVVADAQFKDVLAEVRQLGVPIIRYPGGNFVSGYNWLDGVGPKKDRPRVLNRASNSIESNQFGTNEFITWCRAVGTEPMLAVNLGTGTPERAADLVEYCNVESGTRWSDLRRQHGVEKPYNVKYWCLGNEMDGPWQLGHMSAKEYGLKARDAALQMRTVDPSIRLIACGSSEVGMPTYLEWDRQTLEECYDDVDAISLHHYFGNGPRREAIARNFLPRI